MLRLATRRGRARDPGRRGNGTDSGAEELMSSEQWGNVSNE